MAETEQRESISTVEYAEAKGVSRMTARNRVKNGVVDGFKDKRGCWRIYTDGVDLPAPTDNPTVLYTREVAQRMRCSIDYVRNLAKSKRLPSFRVGGKNSSLRFLAKDVDRFMELEVSNNVKNT